MRQGEVFGVIERVHSRSGHLEKKGKLEKYKRISRRIQKRIWER